MIFLYSFLVAIATMYDEKKNMNLLCWTLKMYCHVRSSYGKTQLKQYHLKGVLILK